MDILNKSKVLNVLIPKLIDKTEYLTGEMKTRLKLNKIFSELENKASTQFNYFINNSNKRYNFIKLGNDLNLFISNNRSKIEIEANKVLKDKFYNDLNVENEKEKMKYKSTSKIHNDIKNIFSEIKIPLEIKDNRNSKRKIKILINKIKKEVKKEKNNKSILKKPNNITYNNKEKNKINKEIFNLINFELEKERESIGSSIKNYLNNINKSNYLEFTPTEILNKTPYKNKPNINLPNIKLLNYLYTKPIQKKIIKKDIINKPDIIKVLPYSKLGRYFKSRINRELSLKDIQKRNCPFLTETNICINKRNSFRSTANLVYDSANRELQMQSNFNRKRRKINDIFGSDDFPKLNTYDDIIFQNSEILKSERINKAKKLNESEKYVFLSPKERMKEMINDEIKVLDNIEKNFFKRVNLFNIRKCENKQN